MTTAKVLHVRHGGKSRDVPITELRCEEDASDEEIKKAVANFLDLGTEELTDYTLVRHQNGNMTLRPEATFGEEVNGTDTVEINFPVPGPDPSLRSGFMDNYIKHILINGVDLMDNPLPFRKVEISITPGGLPEIVIHRIPPIK